MARLFDAGEFDHVKNELVGTVRSNAASQARLVRATAREGALLTRQSARRTARRHGRHYPKSIKATQLLPTKWWWGPKEGDQHAMSFEEGSRNQARPHLNHAKVADVIEPLFPNKVENTVVDAFPSEWS